MKVLIITVGGTPQVVTETVYALITSPKPWFPDRIILATTAQAAGQFENGNPKTGLAALTGPSGRLRAMYECLGCVGRHVEPEIWAARRPSGALIDDIRSNDEVSAFANTLLRVVREVTSDERTDLHLSLAGGRKTMSFIAGTVMSIYGRAGHVLSHALIEPQGFEFAAHFWWPGQPDPVPILDRQGSPTGETLDPSTARVVLHTTPFIRLRAYLPDTDIFRGDISYEAAVERANEALAIDHVVVDLPRSELRIGRYAIHLEAKQLALFAVIALGKIRGRKVASQGQKGSKKPTLGGSADDFIQSWASLLAAMRHSNLHNTDHYGFDTQWKETKSDLISKFDYVDAINYPLTGLRKAFREVFPPSLAQRILASGRTFETGFSADQIEIIPPLGVEPPN